MEWNDQQSQQRDEEARTRSEEEASTVLETLTKRIKLIYMLLRPGLRHKTVRWMTLFVVSCYYFPLLGQCAFYWPLKLIFLTNVGRIGLFGCLLWLPFTDNIEDAASTALETLTKTIQLIYMSLIHQSVGWITIFGIFGVSCYYFPLLRLFAIYWTLRMVFCTHLGRIGLLGGLLLLLFTGNIEDAASITLETLTKTIQLIYMSFTHETNSWIILLGACCYYSPLLKRVIQRFFELSIKIFITFWKWTLYLPLRMIVGIYRCLIGTIGWLLFRILFTN